MLQIDGRFGVWYLARLIDGRVRWQSLSGHNRGGVGGLITGGHLRATPEDWRSATIDGRQIDGRFGVWYLARLVDERVRWQSLSGHNRGGVGGHITGGHGRRATRLDWRFATIVGRQETECSVHIHLGFSQKLIAVRCIDRIQTCQTRTNCPPSFRDEGGYPQEKGEASGELREV
nr:hypothetical protein Iba_chr08eCG0850 [Ipomoea batatas]